MTDVTNSPGTSLGNLYRRTRSTRWRHLLRVDVCLSMLIVAAAVVFSLAPEQVAPYGPLESVADRLLAPSAEHWFGTDQLGRDLFSRVVYGAAPSMAASAIAAGLAASAGILLGVIAGFVGGATDSIIMRIVDVLLAIPSLLLSLAVITALGFGTVKVGLAVGVAGIAVFARMMRGETLRHRSATYVEAAIGLGVSRLGVLFRHVLPNAWGPVLVLATLEFGSAFLSVAALSFLGFGAPPPSPEWGSLVAGGRNFLGTSWWLTILPGLAVAAVVLAVNRIGRAMEAGQGNAP